MISSRWPRPIGISASIALSPVAIGSLHRFARNDAGRLDVDAHALVGLDRTLAVDRIAERIDDTAEQALADGNVDDRAGALDGLPFLDLAVLAEDDDADVVGLEIERHAAHAVLELDHLAGLHVVEAVGAGDAVADREHLTDFGDFGLLAEVLDLVLEDGGNFCGANVHQRASFIAILIALSLVRSDVSTMRLPTLTISPPMIAGSILTSKSISLPPVTDLSALFSASTILVAELLGDGDLRGHLALVARNQRAIAADHVAHGKQPPVGGDHAQEVGGDALDAGLVEDGAERGELLVSAEHRAAHQPGEIGVAGDQRVERVEVVLDRIGRLLLERELEQGVGVAARHSRNDGVLRLPPGRSSLLPLHRPGAFPEGGASCWNSRGNSDSQSVTLLREVVSAS